jgi:hypothetical protein
MTKKKQVLKLVCKCSLKKKRKYHIYISIQNFVEAPLAAITALSLLGYDATSLVFRELISFSSADLPKLCQVRWGALLHSYFQVSPEMCDRVQVWAGPLKDFETCPKAAPASSWLCA